MAGIAVAARLCEKTMCALLNGQIAADAPLSMFPCSSDMIRNFREVFQNKVPNASITNIAGGLSKHYDLETKTTTGTVRTELKVSKQRGSPDDVLQWAPWKDTVQFLQGQYKSKLAKQFLGDCGEPMVIAWYNSIVQPFATEKVPSAASMTCAGYMKAMSTIGMTGKQEPSAVSFISALRESSELQKELQRHWLAFEDKWFSDHHLEHDKLFEVIKKIIEEKDLWILVSNNQIVLVDGLKVNGLDFVGPKPKPRGGTSFHYLLTLQRGDEMRKVPIELKFHWKNGGQAVQNLNFMIL